MRSKIIDDGIEEYDLKKERLVEINDFYDTFKETTLKFINKNTDDISGFNKPVKDIKKAINIMNDFEKTGLDCENIQTFLKYRIYSRFFNFDCDSSGGQCDFTNSIYDKLWGWTFLKNNSPIKKYRLRILA